MSEKINTPHLWVNGPNDKSICKICGMVDSTEWPVKFLPEECPGFDQGGYDKFFGYLNIIRSK